jgi:oligoendopeptidase F
MSGRVPPRSEVRADRTWNMQSVFPDDAAWESAILAVEDQFADITAFQGRLGESADVLADYFDAQERLYLLLGKVYVYASGTHNVDTMDAAGTARHDRALGVFGRAAATVAFVEPELLSVGAERLRAMIEHEPRLSRYEHFVDDLLRQASHVRSSEVEEVLGMLQDAFATATSIHAVLTDTDMRFRPARSSSGEERELAQGNYNLLLTDSDREVRRTAWESYTDSHLALRNSMASCISAGVKRDVFSARARRYGSSLEAALAPGNIPIGVFHNLVEAFKRNLPTWHRYWRVRRKALGYEELFPYDVWAPLGAREQSIGYEEAVELICEGMAPLGQEYVDTVRRGCQDERWVDVYPNQGKTSGAYSDGFPGTYPFILMSYTGDVESVSTLAHELGHSLHSYFAWKTQPLVYDQYSMFVAETASNFNQALVRDHLVRERADRDFQLTLIEETMSNFHRYFFIMPTLARLELEMHERVEAGGAVTAEYLSERTAELFEEGYGGEMVVDRERVGITWAEFSSHMYGNFYVFQYATGISAANALARGVVEGGAPAAERYIEFLKAGNSLYPIDALRLAGVDMATPEPVDRAFGVLAETVDRLETLVG